MEALTGLVMLRHAQLAVFPGLHGVCEDVGPDTWAVAGRTDDLAATMLKSRRSKLAVTVGFKVLPRRWVVERSFGWLMRQRCLVRDYETTKTSASAWS